MTLRLEFDLQDLIECDVLLEADGSLIGWVLDVYDGTGRFAVMTHLLLTAKSAPHVT